MKNDIERFVNCYFNKEINDVKYYGNGKSVLKFQQLMERATITSFDAPDGYILDESTVYIVEHFEADCYKNNKKGSTYKQDLFKIEKEFENKEIKENYVTDNSVINGISSYNFYIDNVLEIFNKHYNHIGLYRENVKEDLKKKGYSCEGLTFKLVFLLEDASPVGTQVYDGNTCVILNYLNDRNFLNSIKTYSDLDYIVSSYRAFPDDGVWFMDMKEIETYINESVDFGEFEFLDFRPHVLSFKAVIN